MQKLAVVDTKEEGTDGKVPDGKKTEIKSEVRKMFKISFRKRDKCLDRKHSSSVIV